MAEWKVVCEPKGENPGKLKQAASAVGVGGEKNIGGMLIYITDGNRKEEVCRVAFIRRNSKNPKVGFDKKFKEELEKAKEAARLLNGLFKEAGEVV